MSNIHLYVLILKETSSYDEIYWHQNWYQISDRVETNGAGRKSEWMRVIFIWLFATQLIKYKYKMFEKLFEFTHKSNINVNTQTH